MYVLIVVTSSYPRTLYRYAVHCSSRQFAPPALDTVLCCHDQTSLRTFSGQVVPYLPLSSSTRATYFFSASAGVTPSSTTFFHARCFALPYSQLSMDLSAAFIDRTLKSKVPGASAFSNVGSCWTCLNRAYNYVAAMSVS